MSKQDFMKVQTYVLRVNIDCEGCKQKVKKLLEKTDGLYSSNIDAEQGRITVSGNVDLAKLIKKLEKLGKRAVLWGVQKVPANNFPNSLNFQFKNSQIQNGNGGKNPQFQQHKNFGGHEKGTKDLMVPQKDKKSVKFNVPEAEEDFDASDYSFDDLDDDFDYGSDAEEDEHDLIHGQHLPNKMTPVAAKGSAFNVPVVMTGKAAGGVKEGKNGGGGKKKGGKKKQNDTDKNGGKGGGGFLGLGKKAGGLFGFGKKSGTEAGAGTNKVAINGGFGAGGGKHNGNGPKKSGGKKAELKKLEDGFGEFGVTNPNKRGKGGGGIVGGGRGNAGGGAPVGGWNMGQMSHGYGALMGQMGRAGGNMGPVDNYPIGYMGSNPALRSVPVMDGGHYYQGMGYNHPQYMPMMMNQHRPYGSDMHPPMMYGPPYPAMNYPPPPPMPPPVPVEPYTNVFSDENAGGCSIM